MLRNNKTADELETIFRRVQDDAIEPYRKGTLNSEDMLTASLIKELNKVTRQFDAWGESFRVNITGYDTPDEANSGADLAIIYRVSGPNINDSARLVLLQSKMYGATPSNLADQCNRMLKISNESYVISFSKDTIKFVPAFPIYIYEGWGGKYNKYWTDQFWFFMRRFMFGYHGEKATHKDIDELIKREYPIKYFVRIGVTISDDNHPEYYDDSIDYFENQNFDLIENTEL